MKNWTLKPSKSRLTGWNKNRHQRKRAAGLWERVLYTFL